MAEGRQMAGGAARSRRSSTRISGNIWKRKTTTPRACSAIPRPCRRSWSRRCAGGSRKTIPACPRRTARLPICGNSARAGSMKCSAARRATAATCRSCSTATRWPRTTNTSSSAARGIRRTINCRRGAPTPRARNISRFACATGRPGSRSRRPRRGDRRRHRLEQGLQQLLLRQARRQPPPDAGLAPSARHQAGRRHAGL